ncbi:DapH/DapD/GlmU-related protein [Micromonospora zamorensis]|uniref:Acetyltransferase-like isoleucine patch superfamily enzyme n=2 Tax=Micromonospora TaxID=1873 RepID=A0A7Y9X7Z2_9ACTN|nr:MULTISPECIES: DapH/DapD/GlmU-related protein [Micromonospora]MCG5470398.1 acyltransferase [Micromonospora cabrerizensis]NYH46117.1 acetyltransferase-like isoleucine patch superfamily enzyme [Micromonospora jinlongensis]TQJ21570.1 succinyltransferase-like protein [Micromonospora sp. A202]
MIRRVQDHLAGSRDPEAFARSLGVKLNGRVKFYAVNRAMFGSEPWLITMGDNVYITAGVQFVTHDGGTLILRKDHPELDWTAPITIGNDVYIGMRSMILAGVNIGNRCVIGAGSIVTRDIPDNTVAAGVPARPLRTTDEYLKQLQAKSLGIGHLAVQAKHEAIKKIYGVTTV